MKIIEFEPILNGVKRITIPKFKVKGYIHSYCGIVHCYKRGHIIYTVTLPIFPFYCSMCKFNQRLNKYVDVTYDEFHKFIDIKRID